MTIELYSEAFQVALEQIHWMERDGLPLRTFLAAIGHVGPVPTSRDQLVGIVAGAWLTVARHESNSGKEVRSNGRKHQDEGLQHEAGAQEARRRKAAGVEEGRAAQVAPQRQRARRAPASSEAKQHAPSNQNGAKRRASPRPDGDMHQPRAGERAASGAR